MQLLTLMHLAEGLMQVLRPRITFKRNKNLNTCNLIRVTVKHNS